MRRYETLETLFGKVDLSFAEKVVNEAYDPEDSSGRPPRKPLGVFKAHLLRRVRQVPSDRMCEAALEESAFEANLRHRRERTALWDSRPIQIQEQGRA
jgi:hypothetical protein